MNPVRNFKNNPINPAKAQRIPKGMKRIKALVLLSGGLDSILAIKILQEQGIKVKAVSFKSLFFNEKQASKAAQDLKIPLKVIDISKEHLNMVKNPKHGYGKRMNPCIDCHILMLRTAKRFAKLTRNKNAKQDQEGFDFVATGEVLGERPMSQNRRTLKLVKEESSLQGFLLRPLSAKLLPITIPEEKGWVERERLFDLSGRSRKRQIELAQKWKIKYYPTPAGGCLLTDLEFSKRLKELFLRYPACGGNDIELLKLGRHFGKNKVKIVVGRNQEEDLRILRLAQRKDILIELKDYPGPVTLVRNYGASPDTSLKVVEKAKALTQHYSKKARDKKEVRFKIWEKK